MLEEGKKAPAFNLPSTNGKNISLSSLKGGPVVLYFYPRDNTPGCTTESCDFRDWHPEFKKLGATVLGISADSMKSHEKFSKKLDLPFPLLSDEDKVMLEKYSIWREKKLYGRIFMGIVRSTVLVDKDGKIARIWPKVKVKGHVEEVLEALKQLS
jgi:thioredoxin-dependent peroxiredoxin